MPTYSEIIHRHGRDGSKKVLRMYYTQPLVNHLMYKAYHAYDTRVWKVPGVRRLERFLWDRHAKTCDNDCGDFTDMSGEPIKDCAYVPLTNRQDLRCFDLHHKNRVEVREEEVAE